jgi:ribonuclease HI
MGQHPIADSSNPARTLDHVLRRVAHENRSRRWLALCFTLGKHVRYVLRLHFPASNNVAEYEALVNGLRITVELGVQCLDARGDS